MYFISKLDDVQVLKTIIQYFKILGFAWKCVVRTSKYLVFKNCHIALIEMHLKYFWLLSFEFQLLKMFSTPASVTYRGLHVGLHTFVELEVNNDSLVGLHFFCLPFNSIESYPSTSGEEL